MASWVSPKVEVRRAGVRGEGTFAAESVARGEVVIVQGGRVMSYGEIERSPFRAYHDHCFQIDSDLLIAPERPEDGALDGVFKVNHSCEPSCGFRGQIVLVAMRDIEAGEEITYDYAMTDADRGGVECTEMECLCGKPACRGVVTGTDWRLPALRERYEGFFSTFIRRLQDEGE